MSNNNISLYKSKILELLSSSTRSLLAFYVVERYGARVPLFDVVGSSEEPELVFKIGRMERISIILQVYPDLRINKTKWSYEIRVPREMMEEAAEIADIILRDVYLIPKTSRISLDMER